MAKQCYKCGTTEDLDDNWEWDKKKKQECFKCSIKLRYNLKLPFPKVNKDWLDMAKASQKRILERHR